MNGLSSNNAWLIKQKPDHKDLFYILVRVGDDRASDRFFAQSDASERASRKSRLAHLNDPTSGFGWSYLTQERGTLWSLAPVCPQGGIRIIGHGVQHGDTIFCCGHRAMHDGVKGLSDRD